MRISLQKRKDFIMTKRADELVELGKYLFDNGYIKGTAGNLSLKNDDDSIWATASNSNLGYLSKDKLSKVSLKGEELNENKPTKEISFHLAIFKQSTEKKAVIHLHSSYLTALSCLNRLDKRNVIKAFTPYMVMRLGSVPLIPYYSPGSIKIAEDVAKLAKNHDAFLLANHGAIVSGKDIWDACYKFEELEEAAKLFFLLKGQDIRYLTSEEIQKLKGG